jgi:membrane fusion protein (multidrug efflux system)
MTATTTEPTTPIAVDAPMSTAADPAASAKQRSTRKAFIVLALVIGLMLVGVLVYVLVTRGKVSTDNATVQADVVPIATRVGGTVLHVFVDENQRVTAGQPLLDLDGAEYSARVQQAEGELAQAEALQQEAEAQELIMRANAKGGFTNARAQLVESSAKAAGAKAGIVGEQAALTSAQAVAKHADTEFGRSQNLLAENAISQQQFDNTKLVVDSAHAALKQEQAKLMAADDTKRAASLGITEAQGRLAQSRPVDAFIAAANGATALARGKVVAAQGSLDLARLQLTYTHVAAPAAGRVSGLTARLAQTLSAGQPVAQFVPDLAYVTADFKETQTGDMHAGQRAKIWIDAYPHRSFEGRVESLSAGTGAVFSLLPPDNATGNFVKVVQRVPVRIAFIHLPSDIELRSGLSADVTVYLK